MVEDNMIDEMDHLLSSFPYVGEWLRGGILQRFHFLAYGKTRHRMLNYLLFYMAFEDGKAIAVINILPSRFIRKRTREFYNGAR